jgi:hypothetical protein
MGIARVRGSFLYRGAMARISVRYSRLVDLRNVPPVDHQPEGVEIVGDH